MLEFRPIGTLHTCFKEKFGIPRQSGLVPDAAGVLKLSDDPFLRQALKGIEGFSHLWIVFVFHEHGSKNWKPTIRPPRLGGARKVGVLASRSPHRPNPIGLSAVKLEKVDWAAASGPELHLSGLDILDGTPVLDIKPYLPYADAIPEATSGWAGEQIERQEVHFTPEAESAVERASEREGRPLRGLILQIMALDPRPAFQKMPRGDDEAVGQEPVGHGFRLFNSDVKWELRNGKLCVTDVVPFL
jgi:tRNA (adenine37-N6)-methyltransferase